MKTKPFDLGEALLGNAPLCVNGKTAHIVQAPIWVYTGDAFVPYGLDGRCLDVRIYNFDDLAILDRKGNKQCFDLGDALLQNKKIVTFDSCKARIVQAPIWVSVGQNKLYLPYDYEGHILAQGWSKNYDLKIVVE